MTLEMPSDPFGTPGGLFVFLDPLQEVSPSCDPHPPPDDPSPGFDFIMDFDPDLDDPTPFVEVNPSPPPVSTLAPRMPTILEEEEKGEEDGDVTITPSEAQRALLPPDRFARPPSAPQDTSAADASQGTFFDPLDTPRPRGTYCFYSSCWLRLLILGIVSILLQLNPQSSPRPLQTCSILVPPPKLVLITPTKSTFSFIL